MTCEVKDFDIEIANKLDDAADAFIKSVRDYVGMLIVLQDVDTFDSLIEYFGRFTSSELLNILREKGFSEEISELADKAGCITIDEPKKEDSI